MQSRRTSQNVQFKKPKKKLSIIPFFIIILFLLLVVLIFRQMKSKNSDSFTNLNVGEHQQMDTQFVESDTSAGIKTPEFTPAESSEPVQEQTSKSAEPEPQDTLIKGDLQKFSDQYDAALRYFYNEQYQQAMNILNQLVTAYPDHYFQVNCKYWIGECHFGMLDFNQALKLFQNVIAFGETYKSDDAILMIGRCYQKLNDKEKARTYFNKLISEFPNSEYVPKARLHLSRL